MESFTGEYQNYAKHQVPVKRHVILMESQIKELKKGNDQLSFIPTITVKSVGKAATLYLFFSLLSPSPGPMLSKTLMYVPVIVLLYPNIEYRWVGGGGGDVGYLAKEKGGLFLRIKMDYG